MENPFRTRATEFLKNDEAFLAIVSPEPVRHFLSHAGESGTLYDRLVLLRGTPGSGKTTLARLFEFPSVFTLFRNRDFEGHKQLDAALAACRATADAVPRLLACRLPLETDYRDFWEFPYTDELKTNLMTALIQARSVLGWFRHLGAVGVESESVGVVIRAEASEIAETIGGTAGTDVRSKAAAVEKAIYKVMTSLVAPPPDKLPAQAVAPYRPFDVIEGIEVPKEAFGLDKPHVLLPLVILDDAHVLHPSQFQALERFLLRRELRVARWMIARFDVLLPEVALAAAIEERADAARFPGVTAERDKEQILLQSSGQRRKERTRFRSMAKDMAARYLRRMPLLNERGLTVLANLLGTNVSPLNKTKLRRLTEKVAGTQNRLKIPDSQRQSFTEQIANFRDSLPEDVTLQMLNVMMHRYDIRRNRSSTTLPLFDESDETEQDDSSIVVAANGDVLAAAVFQLLHEYDRPFYYGIDELCDASSENAEQFLQLAGVLVEEVITQMARGRTPTLTPEKQHKLLREHGSRTIERWNFPHDNTVQTLVNEVATRCLKKSLEPNGAVVANAYGILQEQFDSLAADHPDLARVLQFAVAYNAVTLVPHYSCKKKTWCLLELGGMVLLKHGLTLKRGGFIEGTAERLNSFIGSRQR